MAPSPTSYTGFFAETAQLPLAQLERAMARLCADAPGAPLWPPPILEQRIQIPLHAVRGATAGAPSEPALVALLQRLVAQADRPEDRSLPGCALWLKRAAQARVVLSLRSAAEMRELSGWLGAPERGYETRCEAVKQLQKGAASSLLDGEQLAGALRGMLILDTQTSRKVVCRSAELLAQLYSTAQATPQPGEWRTLSALLDEGGSNDARLRCAALRCLGLAVRAREAGAAASLVRHALAAADYGCASDIRESAALALSASRLLLDGDAASEEEDELSLSAWLLEAKLLQDEDAAVRAAASSSACAALGCPSSPSPVLLSRAVRHCAVRFGGCIALHDWLLDAVCASELLVAEPGNLVRRLFDKEADNHHAEALRCAQVAARELRRLASAGLLGDAFRAQAAARMQASAAGCAAQLASARSDGGGWGAGLSCHECVFMPLFRTLLGLWALGCPDAPLLAELGRCEGEGMLHPLLRGMRAILSGEEGPGLLFLLGASA